MCEKMKERLRGIIKETLSGEQEWHGPIDMDDPSAGYWIDIDMLTTEVVDAFNHQPDVSDKLIQAA